MMRLAPAFLQPMMTAKPTAPSPQIAHVLPGSTPAVFSALKGKENFQILVLSQHQSSYSRSISSGQATSQQADLLQRRLLVDLADGNLRHDRVLRESRATHEVEKLLAFAAETRSAVGHDTSSLSQPNFLAQIGLLVEAKLALLALRRVERNDMVAGHKVDDSLANRLNNSCAFVAENRGEQAFRIDA